MAHQSFRVLDSDMHIIEPPDLWQRTIDADRGRRRQGWNYALNQYYGLSA